MARNPGRARPQSLENAALLYLRRFASSTENLRRVLMRGVERSVRVHGTDRDEGRLALEALVTSFQASRLVGGGAYAGGRAVALHRRGVPAQGIHTRLMEKGVASEHIEPALAGLAETAENTDFSAAVSLARRRRLGLYRPLPTWPATRGKDLAAPARAGSSHDVARRIFEAKVPEELASTD